MSNGDRKTAIVTGGLAGIGRATAQALTKDGFRVAVGARRGDDPAIQASARDQIGPDTIVHGLDVRSESSVDDFCRFVRAETGRLDALVNAAGISVHQPVTGHGLRDWRDVIETNLTGPFLMSRASLPDMV